MIVPANPRIAIAGATGAVGETLRDLIVARNFPYQSLHLLASQRSAGRLLEVDGVTWIAFDQSMRFRRRMCRPWSWMRRMGNALE